jgi:hypothetical protein
LVYVRTEEDTIYSIPQQKEGEFTMRLPSFFKFASAGIMAAAMLAAPLAAFAQSSDTVLKPEDTKKLLPASVFYKGQSATTQLRNSGGVKFADGYFVLATMVDTSGYSSDVQAKYQAYFITEAPIKIGGQSLPAGVYGVGFVANNRFIVTDVGAHDVLTADTSDDAGLKRPTPLQVIADPAGGFRLYAGRRYVVFSR